VRSDRRKNYQKDYARKRDRGEKSKSGKNQEFFLLTSSDCENKESKSNSIVLELPSRIVILGIIIASIEQGRDVRLRRTMSVMRRLIWFLCTDELESLRDNNTANREFVDEDKALIKVKYLEY